MHIPFVGGSKTARGDSANVDRTVNLYVEMDQGSPRAPIALYGMPGLTLRATLASGPCRGALADGARWVFVSGSNVYSISSTYVVTDCGAITTSSGRVSMATNGSEVIIVDGTAGWLLTGTTLAQITDTEFPDTVTSVTFMDGYFVVCGDGTQKVYWSENPNDGAAWDGTDFASAEGAYDGATAVISDGRTLWVFGFFTIEPWVNTGAQLFARDGSTLLENGAATPWTVARMDGTIYWMGQNLLGRGIVYRADGYTPRRVSTHALESEIAGYSTISDAFAYSFVLEGHSFYVLTFPTANKTHVYDAATEQWTEWVYRDPLDNSENRHRSVCWAASGGVHLVGDWESGKVYSLEMDVYTDNGDPIKRLRRTQSLAKGGKHLFFSNLQLDMKTGVGLVSGQGSDPLVMLRYSDDDGESWSNEKTKSIGAIGESGKAVRFGGSLGRSARGKGRVWEVSMTDPVEFVLRGADVDVTEGS